MKKKTKKQLRKNRRPTDGKCVEIRMDNVPVGPARTSIRVQLPNDVGMRRMEHPEREGIVKAAIHVLNDVLTAGCPPRDAQFVLHMASQIIGDVSPATMDEIEAHQFDEFDEPAQESRDLN